jgi:CSLREA domain-containing protein
MGNLENSEVSAMTCKRWFGSLARVLLAVSGLSAAALFWYGADTFARGNEAGASLTALTNAPNEEPNINFDGDAVFTVTKTADTNDGICDSDCSFREALTLAQNGDTITFSPLFNAPQTISLLTPLPNVTQSISIQGPGANLLTLRREPNPQILFRIFQILSSSTISISGLTITNGDANFNEGGAIRNAGTLTITNCVITGNRAAVGGGIRNSGNLTVIGSTLSNNIASIAAGGLRNDSPGVHRHHRPAAARHLAKQRRPYADALLAIGQSGDRWWKQHRFGRDDRSAGLGLSAGREFACSESAGW